MAQIKVNKPEAARRQIDEAIRMLFDNRDPVAIHTVASAAFRVLRDLHEHAKTGKLYSSLKARIVEGKEEEFWAMLNGPSNFLKHADRDPYDVLQDIAEEINDSVLGLCVGFYEDLGYSTTPEMRAFIYWTAIYNPRVYKGPEDRVVQRQLDDLRADAGKPRDAKLRDGKTILDLTLASRRTW